MATFSKTTKRRSMTTAASAALASIIAFAAPAAAENRPACEIDQPPANCRGLWSTTVDLNVPNGAYVHVPNPGCMGDAGAQLAKVHAAAIAMANPKLALFAGPISQVTGPAMAHAFKSQGGDLGRIFSPYAKNGALCAPVVAVIPAQAQYVGYRLLATDRWNGNRMASCPSNGTDCSIAWSKYQAAPVVTSNAAMKTVHTVFMNWKHDRPRTARMIVFYRMPSGDTPGQAL